MTEKQQTVFKKRDYKVEKPPLVKKIDEKIQTYSFPGQFISTSTMQNNLFKEFGDKSLKGPAKKSKYYLRFDPTTEQIEQLNNL